MRQIRDGFAYSWPSIARAAGLVIAGTELAVWALVNREPNSGLLGFAAALIIVPNATGNANGKAGPSE